MAVPTARFVQASKRSRGAATETNGPVERHAKKADGGPPAVLRDVLGGAESIRCGRQVVARLEGGQIAHEVDVAAALHVHEGENERVVGVEAARENQREYVHSGVTTVRVARRTGPKYRLSKLSGAGVATKAWPGGTSPQKR